MHVPGFLRSRAAKVTLLVVGVVVVSVVAIKSQTSAPSLSSIGENNHETSLRNAAGLTVTSANAASLGGGSSAASIQGQAAGSVQPSGQMQTQNGLSPQTSGTIQQPAETDTQMPTDPVRPRTSSALKGTVAIRNTGSTNTSGWTLYMYTDGSGALSYESGGDSFWNNPALKQYPKGYFDVNRLADLIGVVGSMNKLQPSGAVMKSVSFGTSEYATYLGSTSGDLQADYSGTSNATQQLHSYLLDLVRLVGPNTSARISPTPIIEPGPR
ncbi:MAG TPA: hypothetical protein VFL85_04510 [Candidatus Saccharimonadales bacterium]|nr:hypothetical protein [Candidatus Saccharimonadales bacterium]